MNDTHPKTRRAFLIGLRPDGSPTCHPMVALEREGDTTFNAYRKSTKVRNFQRDPRAAVVLLEDWQAPPSHAVCLTGVLEEIDPGATAEPTPSQQVDAVLPVSQVNAERARRRLAEGKRMLLRLREQR